MQKYVESETLELKEKYTDVICKEIVSFLNTSVVQLLLVLKMMEPLLALIKLMKHLGKYLIL